MLEYSPSYKEIQSTSLLLHQSMSPLVPWPALIKKIKNRKHPLLNDYSGSGLKWYHYAQSKIPLTVCQSAILLKGDIIDNKLEFRDTWSNPRQDGEEFMAGPCEYTTSVCLWLLQCFHYVPIV